MKIPRFIRQWMADFLVVRSEEWGGLLHDYANGKWTLLHTWHDQKGSDEAIEITGNMMDRGRDAIFITTVKCGFKRGMFIVTDSERNYYSRAFWDDIYPAREAYAEVVQRCRETADKMGFRRPDAG